MSHTDKKEDFKKELYRLWSMHADRKNYKVSRRDLIKGMAGLGLGAGAIKMLMNQAPFSVREAWAADGATPEERAINGAKALFADSPKQTISIMYPSGSGGNLSPFTEEWKELTGFDVELIEVPVTETHQKAMQEAVAKTGRYDIMIPAPLSLADLAESGVARPLDDFMDKYDPEVYEGPNKLQFPVSDFGQKYKGKTYGLYCDGDWWHLSYRKDKLAEKGLAPKSKREMVHTWDEYDALCAEMHDPDNDFWGALEYRSPFWNKFHWMTRVQAKGHFYFDEDMNSMAGSEQSIETLKELIALQDIMPPEQFTYGFTENYAQYYAGGRGFCEFGWPSLWRYSNDPTGSQSIIAGKDENGEPAQTAVSKVPGVMHNGELIRIVHPRLRLGLRGEQLLADPGGRILLLAVDHRADDVDAVDPERGRLLRPVARQPLLRPVGGVLRLLSGRLPGDPRRGDRGRGAGDSVARCGRVPQRTRCQSDCVLQRQQDAGRGDGGHGQGAGSHYAALSARQSRRRAGTVSPRCIRSLCRSSSASTSGFCNPPLVAQTDYQYRG